MAKFCGNCGAQLDDAAKVCGNCGTPYTDGTNGPSLSKLKIPGVDLENPEKKKALIKNLKRVAVVVAVIIVVVIAANVISSFVGYKGAVRKLMKAYEEYDMNTLMTLASDISMPFAGSEDEEYIEEIFSNRVSNMLDYYEDEVGHDVKIKYEINDSYELPERKLDELLTTLEENYDYDASFIEEIKAVDMTLTISGADGEMTEHIDEDDLLLVKEDGEWKFAYSVDF